jgi:hypothetical protein
MKSREWQLNWKNNNINFDWMMKLNTNKTLTKDLGVKITNQKNKDWIGENNIWHKKTKLKKWQTSTLTWKREKSRKKKEEMTIGDKPPNHHQHAPHQEEEHMMALPVTRWKAIFRQTMASHAPLKVHRRH